MSRTPETKTKGKARAQDKAKPALSNKEFVHYTKADRAELLLVRRELKVRRQRIRKALAEERPERVGGPTTQELAESDQFFGWLDICMKQMLQSCNLRLERLGVYEPRLHRLAGERRERNRGAAASAQELTQ